ncbi:UDP-4-amino-4,6-dideoxy-N-acetyl-beta-L-altrosamine N-acetyltransferase [Pseudomonas farsensis]|uniref:UDP-4-amino-4, 6-dideoxy-N-acetyl-beta-L-altrosamine N-acetyltransferase n=1 Tax=Pseudomonas farsensis TaxID=2745492 RepID=UPI001CED64B1|nr:UDP-4-amino-4,6-dideoxy-N-acetyl-beta-L-altrosamine N-acetyltransferase [Pseudomonas farsensis]
MKGVLRPMASTDLELVRAWRNHADVRRFMYTQHEIAPQEHRKWFESCQSDPCKHLMVFEKAQAPLGFANVTERVPGRIADWGFYLAPDVPRGSGRELGHAILAFAFANLGLHKLCGQALAYNERSIRFHLALGFEQEGVLRDQHFDGHAYHGIVQFGLLFDEWQALQRDAQS